MELVGVGFGEAGLQPRHNSKDEFAVDAKAKFKFSTSSAGAPPSQETVPTFVLCLPRAGGVGAGGRVHVAARLALPGFIAAFFAVVAGRQPPAVGGAEERIRPRHPLVLDC